MDKKTLKQIEKCKTDYKQADLDSALYELDRYGLHETNGRKLPDIDLLRKFMSDTVPKIKKLLEVLESAPFIKGDVLLINDKPEIVSGMELELDTSRAVMIGELPNQRYGKESKLKFNKILTRAPDGRLNHTYLDYLEEHKTELQLLKPAKRMG